MEDKIKNSSLQTEGIKIDLKVVRPDIRYEYDIFDEHGNKVLSANTPLTSELIESFLSSNRRYLYYGQSFVSRPNPAGLNLNKNAVSIETQEKIKESTSKLYSELLEGINSTGTAELSKNQINRSKELIEGVIDEVAQNDDAILITLKELKDTDEYTFIHSTNVGILASTLALKLGYQKDKAVEMGIGGLFHDIGKAIVGYKIVHKSDPLTNSEIRKLMEHPSYGYKISENNRNITKLQKQIILLHHERPDGYGYPSGLDLTGYSERIPREVRLISLCDVFSALTTERAYKPAYDQKKALRIMQNSIYAPYKKNYQFIFEDFRDFMKGLGFMLNFGEFILNQEEMIRLSSGELARVVELRKSNSLNPLIKLVTDQKLQPRKREVLIDLEKDYSLYIANILDKSSFDNHLLAVL